MITLSTESFGFWFLLCCLSLHLGYHHSCRTHAFFRYSIALNARELIQIKNVNWKLFLFSTNYSIEVEVNRRGIVNNAVLPANININSVMSILTDMKTNR